MPRTVDAPETNDALLASEVNPDREIRIAVVIYGGVSLAIYIHGVTQELLQAVKSTAPADRSTTKPLLPKLSDLQSVYRELGCRVGSAEPFADKLDPRIHGEVHTRFVVDVISGTSAGGINGIFLAKALANDQELTELRTLWIREGDIDLLLNDRRSVRDLPHSIRLETPQKALLNTRRLYYRLAQALDGLDASNRNPPANSPLVDELDLYVTTTDLRGVVLPIPLWDRAVFERRYRSVFRFGYTSEAATGVGRNDFRAEINPFLAFAARCTSSFPLAFDPMILNNLLAVEPWNRNKGAYLSAVKTWKGFFEDYLRSEDGLGEREDGVERFAERAFGDGGYLDNKPFSYATERLRLRRSDRRVTRKLFYVEPSPEHPEREFDSASTPDAIENLIDAALKLPRAERIREDLQRVIERNRVLDRISVVMGCLDQDLQESSPPPPMPGAAYADLGLKDMIKQFGHTYGTYHRVKVGQLTWELSERFGGLVGLSEDSGLLAAIRLLLRSWRGRRFAPDVTPALVAQGLQTENQLLLSYDTGYRERRLRFLQDRLDSLLAVVGREERRQAEKRLDKHNAAQEGGDDRQQERCKAHSLDQMFLDMVVKLAEASSEGWLTSEGMPVLRAVVLDLKREVADVQVILRKRTCNLFDRNSCFGRDIAKTLAATFSAGELRSILDTPLDNERDSRAAYVLANPAGRIGKVDGLMTSLANQLKAVFEEVHVTSEKLFDREAGTDAISGASGRRRQMEGTLRKALRRFHERYEPYDLSIFPLTWRTSAEETSRVDIVRISPDDTEFLSEFSPTDGTRRFYKLAGTRLGNFGSFFDPIWRRSDILWGRLDGAERIIRSALIAKETLERDVVDRLVVRAHAAIIVEELDGLSKEETHRVMYQALVRTTTGKPLPDVLVAMLGKVLPEIERIEPNIARLLSVAEIREDYLREFDASRDLSPDRTVPLFARASQIMGKLLEGVGDSYGPPSKRLGWWLLWFGRGLWGLVEISLPRRLGALLFTYWLRLLYLLTMILMIGGILFARTVLRSIGIRMLLGVVGLDLSLRLTRSLLAGPRRLRTFLLAAAITVLAVGLWTIARWIPGVAPWLDLRVSALTSLVHP